MPIQPPRLDDRRFQDLVKELTDLVPAYTPEYRNPVPGDPGHTLIELFAWLADTILYRVNLIPERQRLEFLRIVGLPMRGARPASGLIGLRLGDLDNAASAVEVETVRPWSVVKGPVDFETRRPVTLLPVEATAYHKRVLRDGERDAVGPLLTDLASLYELGNARPKPYVTTPTFPKDEAVASGVDLVADTVDRSLWLALLAGRVDRVEAVRTALGRDAGGAQQVLCVGVVPADAPPELQDPLTGAEGTARPIPVVWEITTGRQSVRGPEYHELEVLRDATNGLTRPGVVELLLPSSAHIGQPDNDVRENIDAGVGTRPPRLDEEELNDRLVTWVRLRPKHGVDRLAITWAGINAVEVDQRRTVTNLVIGTSTGEPSQRFPLPGGAVEVDGFALDVEEEGRGWVPWQRVDHLALAGPDDRAFVLEPEEGLVDFGDRLRGRIPQRGRRIRVRFMRTGGGAEGNVPAGAVESIAARRARDGSTIDRPIDVIHSVPMRGGAPAETLEQAERRIPDLLRSRDRAITVEDTVATAAATPGVRLGRIEVIKGFKPHQRRRDVPGVVSVMVLPRIDGVMPPNPRPSRQTREAVHEWLSARVPLATELYVIGCEYRPIGVAVGFELREGFGREETMQAVRLAVRRLLWPLSPGGPFEDGSGWPRGRAVRERELEVAIARVPGVDEVRGIRLSVRQEDGTYREVPAGADGSAEIALTEWQLPEILALAVSDTEVPTLGPDADEGGAEVAVPVVPEVC